MNERVIILREAVTKITQMLAGKSISVTQRGVNAYVESDRKGRPIRVNLPYLPDNATEELCEAIQGFLDHEVAHILETDFDEMTAAQNDGCHGMCNILEDARIEKAMARRFQGSGHNLTVTGNFFLNKFTIPEMQKAAAEGDANKVIGILMVPLIRAMAGQYIFQEFMKDKMKIVQSIYDKIADMAPQIEAASSTADCRALAKEITKRLKEDGPKKPDKPRKGSDEPGAGESGTEPTSVKKGKNKEKKGGGKATKKEGGDEGEDKTPTPDESAPAPEEEKEEDKENPAPAPTTPEEEKPEDESEGTGDASEDEKPKDEGSEPGAPDEDEDKEGDEPDAGGEGGTGGEGGKDEDKEDDEGGEGSSPSSSKSGGEEDEGSEFGEEETGNTAAILKELDKEGANAYDSSISKAITNAAAEAAETAPYLIYTKEADLVEPLHVGREYHPKMLSDLANTVDHMVGPLQKDLERAIAAKSLASWENGRRSGRLHAANLSRLAVGDGRVFRKRHEATSKDVAVELVIDASGSMAGSKINLATQSAYALSQVLERIGIPHEVIAFTTGELVARQGELQAEQAKIKRSFTRVESLYMPVLKGFSERLTTNIRERFGWLPNARFLRNNIDGESIEIAARRLMSRREAGKILIVLSDGAPNAMGDYHALTHHLKQVIGDVSKAGVKTVGIGIQSSEVSRFYPKHIVINKVEELPQRVIKELRIMLLN